MYRIQISKSCRKYKPEDRANMDLCTYQRWDQVTRQTRTSEVIPEVGSGDQKNTDL
jgi:hypothetical protein